MKRPHVFPVIALLSIGIALPADLSAEIPFPSLQDARVDSVDTDLTNLAVTICRWRPVDGGITCDGEHVPIRVQDPAIRAKLKQYSAGDYLRLDLVQGTDRVELRDVLSVVYFPREASLPPYARFLVLFACAAAIMGLAIAVTFGKPLAFIIGQDNRYSNSKAQLALWFWLVISSYMATVALRVWCCGWDFFGGVSIPQNLLILSGLSALTYGGAKAITTAKANAADAAAQKATAAAAAAAAANPNLVIAAVIPATKTTLAAGEERLFRDLVQNDDGSFDFGDFQMLVVTMLAVVMYLMLIFHFLHAIEFRKVVALPDVDTTVLALFGIGQGAYLTKKAAGDVGKS